MEKWGVNFQVYGALPAFPYPMHLKMEVQDSPSYHCEGRLRSPSEAVLFVYTLGGRGVFRRKEHEYHLLPETAFFTHSSDSEIGWYYPEDSNTPWTFMWISMFGKATVAMSDDLISKYGNIFSIPKEHPMIVNLMSYRNFKHVIYPLTPRGGADIVFNIISGLASLFETEGVYSSRSLMIKQAQELIVREIEKDFSIAEIAKKFNLSREHFSLIFKKETTETPKEYILKQKILRACRFLKESQCSCKEIADRLGYNSATNFSRAFRSITHLSPRQFRESVTMPVF